LHPSHHDSPTGAVSAEGIEMSRIEKLMQVAALAAIAALQVAFAVAIGG
jgi:hypothetical protein